MKYKVVQCYGEGDALNMEMTDRWNTFTVRADIGRQTVQLIQRGPDVRNYVLDVDMICKPEWPENTPLRYLQKTSAIRHSKKEIMQVVTAWRHEIEKRLRGKIHYKTPSMYAGTSICSDGGLLFNPLQHIAWRLAAPTAPPYEYLTWRSIDGNRETISAFSDVLNQTRQGTTYAAAVCKAFHLPDKPSVRRYLRQTSAFQAVVIKKAMSITDNIDNLITIASGLGDVRNGIWRDLRVIDFLQILAKRYGDKAVTILLKNADSRACWELSDTAHMYSRLTRQNRKGFWEGMHVKVRELHDTIMDLYDRQRIAKQDIAITPEMQALVHKVGSYEFYAPANTDQLIDISQELHNCVKGYADRCAAHKCIIIGVRNQEKIIACIEVRGDEIRQAKLRNNKPASENTDVNRSILTWAKQHHLKPCQCDMTSRTETQLAV
ncbi:PcfJ domain-containing protein [uncultured Megasphaera sp.]|uniref:PcfJ domain-containing protein n=1 Tax=uncultured Megasphaera sp. TaxID=165188 RepID=UPI002658EA0E|nr:PcfJ domain-containing protein [uncultured Megasphaera sp.]